MRPANGKPPGWLRRHSVKLAVSLAVAASSVWLMHRGGLPLAPSKEHFARVRWWTVGGYVGVFCFVHFLRSARWQLLLKPIADVPFRRVLAVSFMGFAAIALLPLRAGEAVRPLLIRQKDVSGWAATGTIAAERILDGLVLSVLLLVGLSLSTPLPDRNGELPTLVPRMAYLALCVFAAAFTTLGVFYAKRDWARRTTERVIGAVSPRSATWLADRVEHVAEGLRFLPNARYSVPFIATTALYWVVNAAGTWLLAWGTGFDAFTLPQAFVTIGVVALGILVPNAPGFFGAYQLSFYAALAVYYPHDMVVGPGAACVLLIYSAQLILTVLASGVGLLLDGESLRGALALGVTASPAENLAAGPPTL